MTEHRFSYPHAAQGRSCAPCEDLALIDEEIRLLIEKRVLICGRVNRAHDSLTSKLPSEIMSKIFMNFLPIDVDNNYGVCVKHRLQHRIRKDVVTTTPVLLSAVCTTWRTIAWSTPQLWTSISVDLSYELHFDVLQNWLARSGALPIYVKIYMSDDGPHDGSVAEDILKLLASYAHRWSFLELDIPPALIPLLRSDISDPLTLHTLKIKGYDIPDGINLGRIPNVRTIYVDNLNIEKPQNLDFKKLDNVEGQFSSVDAVFHVLSSAPCMTRFTFKIEPEGRRPAKTSRNTAIQHDSLTSLNIKFWNPLTQIVLSWMIFPVLQHLEVVISGEDLRLESLLKCVPSIETLEIKLDDNSYSDLLSIDPMLLMLAVTASSYYERILPNLKTLRLRGVVFSWYHIVDFIQAHLRVASRRVTGPPSSEESDFEAEEIRPLRVLYFELPTPQLPPFWMSDVAELLERARNAGFQITFKHGSTFLL